MASMLEELRDAVRSLSTAPGVTLTAVLTLAVGISASTAIFSVVNAVVLRPLTVPGADALVRFIITTGTSTSVAGVPEYEAWRRQSTIDDVAAHRLEYLNLTEPADAEQIPVARVTRGFFQLFRAPVALGRVFTAD